MNDNWQDIKSAPKDGTLVRIRFNDGTTEIARCYEDSGWWAHDGLDFDYGRGDKDITHWQPIVQPPEDSNEYPGGRIEHLAIWNRCLTYGEMHHMMSHGRGWLIRSWSWLRWILWPKIKERLTPVERTPHP